MNYCKICRRTLNGAVSCPGCGAQGVAVPKVRDPHSTAWRPRTPGHEQPVPARDSPVPPRTERPVTSRAGRADSVQTPAKDAAPGPGGGRRGRDVGEPAEGCTAKHAMTAGAADGGTHAAARSHAATASASRTDAESPGRSANGDHRGRRPHKRRGRGLIITGGCIGIGVIVLLFLDNLATAGGDGAPAGSAVAVPMPTPSSTGASTISSPAAPTPSFTAGAFSELVGPSSTKGSVAPSPSRKPTHSATSVPTIQPTGPSAAPTSAPSSPDPTQTSAAPRPPASPSPSPTHVSCFLFCW